MKSKVKHKEISNACDWREKPRKRLRTLAINKTRVFKYKGNFSWAGIRMEKYKSGGDEWAGVIRKTLIGNHGESAKFHVRYFEIAPYGFSSLEKHTHEHVIIGIRGNGICIAGKKKYGIGFLDTVYIKPKETHQLRNPYDKPFGFFCIVNAKRDRPKIIGNL